MTYYIVLMNWTCFHNILFINFMEILCTILLCVIWFVIAFTLDGPYKINIRQSGIIQCHRLLHDLACFPSILYSKPDIHNCPLLTGDLLDLLSLHGIWWCLWVLFYCWSIAIDSYIKFCTGNFVSKLACLKHPFWCSHRVVSEGNIYFHIQLRIKVPCVSISEERAFKMHVYIQNVSKILVPAERGFSFFSMKWGT